MSLPISYVVLTPACAMQTASTGAKNHRLRTGHGKAVLGFLVCSEFYPVCQGILQDFFKIVGEHGEAGEAGVGGRFYRVNGR